MLSSVALLCVGLAPVLAQDPPYITNLARFWDYLRSPPVYPAPQMNGTGDWASAYARAAATVAQMTNEEKQNVTFGYTSTANGCSGAQQVRYELLMSCALH